MKCLFGVGYFFLKIQDSSNTQEYVRVRIELMWDFSEESLSLLPITIVYILSNEGNIFLSYLVFFYTEHRIRFCPPITENDVVILRKGSHPWLTYCTFDQIYPHINLFHVRVDLQLIGTAPLLNEMWNVLLMAIVVVVIVVMMIDVLRPLLCTW